jgi:hypothetical protein
MVSFKIKPTGWERIKYLISKAVKRKYKAMRIFLSPSHHSQIACTQKDFWAITPQQGKFQRCLLKFLMPPSYRTTST